MTNMNMTDMNWYPEGIDGTCPHCGKVNDGFSASDGGHSRPEEGSANVCFYCGGLSFFVRREDGMLAQVKATPEQDAEYATNPLMIKMRRALSYTDSPQLAASLVVMMIGEDGDPPSIS